MLLVCPRRTGFFSSSVFACATVVVFAKVLAYYFRIQLYIWKLDAYKLQIKCFHQHQLAFANIRLNNGAIFPYWVSRKKLCEEIVYRIMKLLF